MNTTEINGFLIDKFNQHDLPEGKTQGICPLCSFDRQPKNQKANCASYDWERGLGTCHNCNNTFQLHTYQRKGSSDNRFLTKEPHQHRFHEFSDRVNTGSFGVDCWHRGGCNG